MKPTWMVAAALAAAGCSSSVQNTAGLEAFSPSQGTHVADERTGELPDLATLDEPLTEKVPIPGSDYVRGRARVVVNAPVSTVRGVIYGFKDYPEFMPFWDAARVIGKRPDGSLEVYMSVKLLYGAMRLWARLEVPKAQSTSTGGVEEYDQRYLEGNLQDFEAKWRLRPIDAERTELGVEVLLHPKVGLPLDVLNNGQTDGARMLVDAVRLRAEGRDED